MAIGVAVDLGTTTVAISVYDLESQNMLGSGSFINPQVAHGADVITRMTYILRHEKGLEKLQKLVISGINDNLKRILDGKNISKDDISEFVFAGNTTMSHILLGLDISGISKAPFLPAYTGPGKVKGNVLGLIGNKDTNVYVVPGIAGHVGGDITAGILAIGLMEADGPHLFIDIGTNGEIALNSGNRVLCASTAAGPAFEGRGIKDGMRAATGAIEKVALVDGQIALGVIGNTMPIGICGSGVIDAIATLLKTGIIDSTGKMPQEAFLLSKDVAIYQEDIRNIQLAKSAIFAGCLTLLNEAGLSIDDLKKISIGGAFGSYINPQSAMDIGLFPKVDISKIEFCGNTSSLGASQILLDKKEKKISEKVAKKVEHIELADREDFSGLFMGNMGF